MIFIRIRVLTQNTRDPHKYKHFLGRKTIDKKKQINVQLNVKVILAV